MSVLSLNKATLLFLRYLTTFTIFLKVLTNQNIIVIKGEVIHKRLDKILHNSRISSATKLKRATIISCSFCQISMINRNINTKHR